MAIMVLPPREFSLHRVPVFCLKGAVRLESLSDISPVLAAQGLKVPGCVQVLLMEPSAGGSF